MDSSRSVRVGIPGPAIVSPSGVDSSQSVSVGIPGPATCVTSSANKEDDSELDISSHLIQNSDDEGYGVEDLLDRVCDVAEKLQYPCSIHSLKSIFPMVLYI